jgi:hypothetical protein
MMTDDPWRSEQVAADLRDGQPGWRLGAPPPGAPGADVQPRPPAGAPPAEGWRPGRPPPDIGSGPAGEPSAVQVTTGDPAGSRVEERADAPPTPIAPPSPPEPRAPEPRIPEPHPSARHVDAPIEPSRPQPGAPPGTPLPGWSTAQPASTWEPAKKKRFSFGSIRSTEPKARPQARRPARPGARRVDAMQAAVKVVLAMVLVGVVAALIAMPGPIHRLVIHNHKPVNPLDDRNTVSATLATQADLGSGWQLLSNDIHVSTDAVPPRPATTPSPVPGQSYADFRDCLGTANADAAGTAVFRSGNNVVVAGAWTDGSSLAASSDLAVTGSAQFVSCLKNELERSGNVSPGSSLIEPLHKPAVGDQALAFRIDVGSNLTYDLFAVQQGRAVLVLQGIGVGRPLDLALELNALQAMSARLPSF